MFARDVDIYFHTEEDAMAFMLYNNKKIKVASEKHLHTTTNENLIWGYLYKEATDLISGFDFRCCAGAYDPTSQHIVTVKGMMEDVRNERLVVQTGARCTSLRRLIKYVHYKGFHIDHYQMAIFVELVRKLDFNRDMELIDEPERMEYK
jgi:hypothetical protein